MPINNPPSRIYLLRHAKSAPAQQGERDFDRPLDDEGFAQAEVVADKAADLRYRPDIVISSTAVRCKQTADAVRRAITETIEPVFVDDLYNGTLSTYLSILGGQEPGVSVMLIGHNPVIEEVLQALAGADQMIGAIPAGYPTAGLAVLDRRDGAAAEEAVWTLSDFVRP